MVLPNGHARIVRIYHEASYGGGRLTPPRELLPEIDPYIVRLLGGRQAESEPCHLEPAAAGPPADNWHQFDRLDVRHEDWTPYG